MINAQLTKKIATGLFKKTWGKVRYPTSQSKSYISQLFSVSTVKSCSIDYGEEGDNGDDFGLGGGSDAAALASRGDGPSEGIGSST